MPLLSFICGEMSLGISNRTLMVKSQALKYFNGMPESVGPTMPIAALRPTVFDWNLRIFVPILVVLMNYKNIKILIHISFSEISFKSVCGNVPVSLTVFAFLSPPVPRSRRTFQVTNLAPL